MSKEELWAFLVLMMCSDPWPAGEAEKELLTDLADRESRRYNFDNWLDAYHRLVAPVDTFLESSNDQS